ncbi:MAG: disulfide bond formation protein B [Candidatus Berkiellales bacterium]
MKLTIRLIYFYLFAFSLFLLAISFLLQYGFHLQPCPLCIIDRILVLLIVICFVVALCHPSQKMGQRLYSLIAFLLCALGILVTSRHLWLIHLPVNEVPACSPSFNYLIETFPLKEALIIILKSSGECAVNTPAVLGLTLPAWTLMSFVLLAVGSLLPWWVKKDKQ